TLCEDNADGIRPLFRCPVASGQRAHRRLLLSLQALIEWGSRRSLLLCLDGSGSGARPLPRLGLSSLGLGVERLAHRWRSELEVTAPKLLGPRLEEDLAHIKLTLWTPRLVTLAQSLLLLPLSALSGSLWVWLSLLGVSCALLFLDRSIITLTEDQLTLRRGGLFQPSGMRIWSGNAESHWGLSAVGRGAEPTLYTVWFYAAESGAHSLLTSAQSLETLLTLSSGRCRWGQAPLCVPRGLQDRLQKISGHDELKMCQILSTRARVEATRPLRPASVPTASNVHVADKASSERSQRRLERGFPRPLRAVTTQLHSLRRRLDGAQGVSLAAQSPETGRAHDSQEGSHSPLGEGEGTPARPLYPHEADTDRRESEALNALFDVPKKETSTLDGWLEALSEKAEPRDEEEP
ncbi:MAG: hypothetical protein VYD19_00700, partial [Myxococcota bacterium]|nr:hypothetical protein [Myxococcota bacterium]